MTPNFKRWTEQCVKYVFNKTTTNRSYFFSISIKYWNTSSWKTSNSKIIIIDTSISYLFTTHAFVAIIFLY